MRWKGLFPFPKLLRNGSGFFSIIDAEILVLDPIPVFEMKILQQLFLHRYYLSHADFKHKLKWHDYYYSSLILIHDWIDVHGFFLMIHFFANKWSCLEHYLFHVHYNSFIEHNNQFFDNYCSFLDNYSFPVHFN